MNIKAVGGATGGVAPKVEGAGNFSYSVGQPVESSTKSFKAELDLLVDGGTKAQKTPAIVKKHIEALMKKRGYEAMKDLAPQWKAQVEKTLSELPAEVQDGARFALTQKILEIPSARRS
ncbi:MAG TPA: hypothetical protein PLZ86_09695 [bacterium]|nr:hypothetical protein [bacterium]